MPRLIVCIALVSALTLASCENNESINSSTEVLKQQEIQKAIDELESWEYMVYTGKPSETFIRGEKDYLVATTQLERLLNTIGVSVNDLSEQIETVKSLSGPDNESRTNQYIFSSELIAKYRLKLDWPSTPQEDEAKIKYLAEQSYRDLSLLWDAYKGLAKQKQMESPKNQFSGYLSAAKSADPKLFQKMKPHHKAACEKALQEIEAY